MQTWSQPGNGDSHPSMFRVVIGSLGVGDCPHLPVDIGRSEIAWERARSARDPV